MDAENFAGGRPVMSHADRARRAQDVVADCRRGMSVAGAARLHGLTATRVRQILAKADGPVDPLTSEHAVEEIKAHLLAIDQVLEDYATVFAESTAANYRLGAIRGRMDALVLKMQIQAQAGVIPRNLAAPGQQHAVTVVFGDIADVLKRHNASNDLMDELIAVMERHTQPHRVLEAVTGRAA